MKYNKCKKYRLTGKRYYIDTLFNRLKNSIFALNMNTWFQ